VGNRGIHLPARLDINMAPSANRVACALAGTPCTASLLPYGALTNHGIVMFYNITNSTYHALQTNFRGRLDKRGSLFQVVYTWSKLISTGSLDGNFNDETDFADSYNLKYDRGPSALNRPQQFVANAVYNLPDFRGMNRFLSNAVGGWEMSGIYSYVKGPSLTVVTGVNGATGEAITGAITTNNSGQVAAFAGRPNMVPGQSCYAHTSNKQQWLNPAAWTIVGMSLGSNGNSGRGICQGPPTNNFDMGIYKNFKASEKLKIQFRIDLFNAFNHFQMRNVNGGRAGGSVALTWNTICYDAVDSNNTNCFSGSSKPPAGATKVVASGLQHNCSPSGACTNDPSSTQPFGGFGYAGNSRGPREIQYAIKFIF
jgi:hypothetical protein